MHASKQVALVVAINVVLAGCMIGAFELYFRAHEHFSGEPFIEGRGPNRRLIPGARGTI